MSSSALFFCEAIESLSILLSFVPFWHKASFSCVYRIFLRRCLKISNNWFQRVYCPNGFVEAAGSGAYHIFAGSGNALEGGKRRPGRLGEDQACLCINRKGSFFSVCFKERRHVRGSKEWKEFLTSFCFWWLICGRKKHGNVQEVLHRCVHMPMYTCINMCVCTYTRGCTHSCTSLKDEHATLCCQAGVLPLNSTLLIFYFERSSYWIAQLALNLVSSPGRPWLWDL